ncbi:hypothetical protein BC938DRAFT_479915, partial [Jimgerdemannia flammicorona]
LPSSFFPSPLSSCNRNTCTTTSLSLIPRFRNRVNAMANFADRRNGENSYLEAMWYATMAHLIVWALAVMIAEYARPFASGIYLPVSNGDGAGRRETPDFNILIAKRVKRVAQLATVGFAMLFAATVITQLGYGGSQTTAIISWLFVLLMVGQFATTLFVDKPAAVIPIQLMSYALIVTMFGLAFRRFEHPFPPKHGHGDYHD